MSTAEQALAAAGITATEVETFGPRTLDVGAGDWHAAHEVLRDELGLVFFDFLTASDELADGFRIVSHVGAFRGPGEVDHLVLRTLVPRAAPRLASLHDVYAGANWHERETFEMFGVDFENHPNLVPLLLPDGFEGNPLRKEFILASRVAKPWPGAKEPGEGALEHAAKAGAPSRRRTLPPGVPDTETWGPRAPGSPDPDPLAAAQASAAPARPRRGAADRRTPREGRPSRAATPPAGQAGMPTGVESSGEAGASAGVESSGEGGPAAGVESPGEGGPAAGG